MSGKMLSYEQGEPLQEWATKFEPNDQMLWKGGFWDQIIFIRYEIHRLFVKTYEGSKANPVMVVGIHNSKSVSLPVYSIKIPGIEVRMRNNFYNWKVSIHSDLPVPDVFHHIIDKDAKISPVYFEGFQDDWIFGSYNEDPHKFSVEIGDKYDLYTFFLVILDAMRQK